MAGCIGYGTKQEVIIMIYEKEKTKHISFPIGGIGTGCVGLAGNGQLVDWEIFNNPNKKSINGYSHFAVKAKYRKETLVKVLHGDVSEDYSGEGEAFGYGVRGGSMAGYPHFRNVVFDGRFPMARLTFFDEDFPAKITLTAFNPLIPHDEYNSCLPAGFFEWEIKNEADEEIEYAIAFSLKNPAKLSVNEALSKGKYSGVFFRSADKKDTEVGYADLAIATDCDDVDVQPYWYRGEWQDGITSYWNNITADARMPARTYDEAGKEDHGTLVGYVKIPAKQARKIRFVLAWNAPIHGGYIPIFYPPLKDGNGELAAWKNHYATVFSSSVETAEYALTKFSEVYEKTLAFTDTLYRSSLSKPVMDAVGANLSVLHSPTVLRYEDGTFWAWEGVGKAWGSCDGTCQHVWNYAYALPYLFPSLERSMREATLTYGTYESGQTNFRIPLPLRKEPNSFRACVDGQMGEVIKCYREWKLSGDSEWLKTHAPKIFKILEYAWSEENPDRWDLNKDGVLEGRQHHTLDLELFGPSSWLQGFYLLALDCGAKIADEVGDTTRAQEYRAIYQKGKKWTNEHLFNGEYFMQKVDISDKSVVDAFGAEKYWNDEVQEIKYQVADGCIIDQMLADWHAHLLGCEGIFDKEKKKTALQSLYKYNYHTSMREVANTWRNFAINDEAGTVICSYPSGVQKPKIPISYCEETMTGFEYALAGLMIAEGMEREGEELVKAVRERYDGERRNPWNEIECGSNYARSMAAFALLPIYSGFTYDMTKNYVGFAPLKRGDGRYFWSVANAWGNVAFEGKGRVLSVLGGQITLSSFGLRAGERAVSLLINGKKTAFTQTDRALAFERTGVETLQVMIE